MADAKELDNIDEKSKLNVDGDSAGMEFQPSNNGEAKIEMPDSGAVGYQCGLTKEELMKYANDPFWIVLRRVLLVLFWLLWIAMLVGAVAIIIWTPKCAAPKQADWYESSPLYEVRVDEFADGDGDQKSDLKGMIEKLPYLDEISISAIVLDKLFNPLQLRQIDPIRGDLHDFAVLTEKKKVLLRVPLSKIFDGKTSSAEKQKELLTTLGFWLQKGAAGFVFDEIEIIEDKVTDLPQLTEEWYGLIQNFTTEEFKRVSILSSYRQLSEDYCNNATMILDYRLTELRKGFAPGDLVAKLEHTAANRTISCRANLVLSNGDIAPLLSRFEPYERDRLVMFSLLADATPVLYFGEEYAKEDSRMPSTLTREHNNVPQPLNWRTIDKFKQEENNFFQVFAKTSNLRNAEYAVLMGDTTLDVIDGNVVAMSRVKKSNPAFVVVSNFASDSMTVDLTKLASHIPESGNIKIVSTHSDKAKGKVLFKEFEIAGHSTVIVEFVPKLDK